MKHKNTTHKLQVKSATIFITRRVPPLDRKNFLLLNLMKLKIWNSYGPAILHTKFERNQRQKNFWHRRVPPLNFSRLRNTNFLINLRGMGSAGPCYHAKIILVLGLNFDFQVVCKWPSRPQSLAMLTAKVRNVPPPGQNRENLWLLLNQATGCFNIKWAKWFADLTNLKLV